MIKVSKTEAMLCYFKIGNKLIVFLELFLSSLKKY